MTQHIRPDFLADWKREQVAGALAKHGLQTTMRPTISSPPHSRRRAVFTGWRTKSGAEIGFHSRGTDAVVPISTCTLVRPEIEDKFDVLRLFARLAATRKKTVRIGVTVSLGGLDVDVSQAKEITHEIRAEIVRLTHNHQLARVFWNSELVLEREPAQHRFGNALIAPPNGSFLQATQQGEDALLTTVKEIVSNAKSVIDLFAGCGTFALPLAQSAEVFAVEESHPMLAALDKGWRHTKGLKKIQTKARDLFRNPLQPDELKQFDAAVIDPPRAGAREQTAQLARSTVAKIAFVSCNPATFARDARTLVDAGYSLDWVQTVDQFLWSGHCELVAQFTRT